MKIMKQAKIYIDPASDIDMEESHKKIVVGKKSKSNIKVLHLEWSLQIQRKI